jgi:hypothetical protein
VLKVNEYPLADCCEAKWKKAKPFKYRHAPVLVSNDGNTDFPLVMQFALRSRRTTSSGKPLSRELRFASKVRSRTTQLDEEMAKEIIGLYEDLRAKAHPSDFSWKYADTLPHPAPVADNRKAAYDEHLEELARISIGRKCVAAKGHKKKGRSC